MNKKGDLTINYIVITILALLVLVVVAIIFREQIVNFIDTIRGLTGGLNTDIQKAGEELIP